MRERRKDKGKRWWIRCVAQGYSRVCSTASGVEKQTPSPKNQMSNVNAHRQEWKLNNRKYLGIHAGCIAGTAVPSGKLTSLTRTGATWCCVCHNHRFQELFS